MTLAKMGGQTFAGLDAITDAPDQTQFVWESNKTWKYKYFNDTLVVQTLNCCSYSYQNKIRTILAPVTSMVGDSMIVIVSGLIQEKYIIADTIIVRFK